ncbi:MAG TPA: SPFH domain-containing protein [Thermoplasmata archaeon]|nr:SPFH domain-containing protein [Thermoplasmata archaeon]
MDYTVAIVALGLIVAFVLIVFLILGLYLIHENQVGIVTRKLGGKRMPPGQVIARHGQIGVQAATLVPGLYYRAPIIWSVQKVPVIEVGPDNIATIEAIDGRPLKQGRRLGDEVESNQFQDGERFLDGGGFKGPQVAFLRPGRYRLNTRLFAPTLLGAIQVTAGKVGLVTAQDGRPLPSRLLVAPTPLSTPTHQFPAARDHNFFQDGPAFLDSGGFRGPQVDTIQPGTYYVNPLLFEVGVIDNYEVPPGFVAVLRSNIGEELDRPQDHPMPVSSAPDFDQKLTAEVESLLTTDRNRRGIWRSPLAPGKYNLNTKAFTAYLVPTSAIMVDWASSERPSAPGMSRPSAAPARDQSAYPYLTADSAAGVEFFKFNQLKVTSKDGFQLEVDVRMVIRILPENAAFVIARFGSVFNLIQQIVHPLIDAEFRNNAGEKQALEFVRSRSQLQQEALDKARLAFQRYMVEAQNLLISYIQVDETLLATQTNKEIAVQQQAQYVEQASAERQRISVQEMTARANLQPQVVQADLQIVINQNNAKAAVKQAEGVRDSTRIVADGNAAAIRRVGEAQADAYHAQADVIGSDKVALIKTVDLLQAGKVRITPDTLVTAGGGADGTNTMFSAYLATLLAQKSQATATRYSPSQEPDYISPLTSAPSHQDPSIPLPPDPIPSLSVPPPDPPADPVQRIKLSKRPRSDDTDGDPS